MSIYHYTAKDRTGKTIMGTLEVETQEEVLRYIKGKSYYPIKISEEKKSKNIDIDLKGSKKITTKDLAIFCRQFATTLRSGITIVDSLNLLSKQTSNHRFSNIINELYDDILKGNALSTAMAKEPTVFPTLLVSMVETGEVSGNLDSVMADMATHFEKEHKINQKVKGALTYPIVVSIVAVFVVAFLLTFVMPTFVSMFESFGSELPAPTRILIFISDSLKNYWYGYIITIILAVLIIKKYIQTPKGRFQLDKFKVKMPVFGQLNNKVVMERFASTISVLLGSGVDILEAVEIVQRVVGNEYIRENL